MLWRLEVCELCCAVSDYILRLSAGGAFDPLGLASADDAKAFRLKTAEIKHGRLAMIAFLGKTCTLALSSCSTAVLQFANSSALASKHGPCCVSPNLGVLLSKLVCKCAFALCYCPCVRVCCTLWWWCNRWLGDVASLIGSIPVGTSAVLFPHMILICVSTCVQALEYRRSQLDRVLLDLLQTFQTHLV